MELLIMRHGQTPGNALRRYIGRTDEPLSDPGRAAAKEAGVDLSARSVYVSPMLRARQTAGICFPNAEQIVCDDLREMDFGDFENRSADDMVNDAVYREWVEGHCEGPCPNGELKADFDSRVCAAFERIVRGFEGERLIIVAHGGTIMSVMSAYADEKRPFYRWYVPNCGIYRARISVLPDSLFISGCELLDRLPLL